MTLFQEIDESETHLTEEGEVADEEEMYRTQMDEALLATECISMCDLTELKSLKSPPVGVKLVMDAVCILYHLR